MFILGIVFGTSSCQTPTEKAASEAVNSDYIRISFSGRDNMEGMKILLASKEDKEMFARFIGPEINSMTSCSLSGKVEFMLNGQPKTTCTLSLGKACNYLEIDEETVSLTKEGVNFLATRYDTYQKINFSPLVPTDSVLTNQLHTE